MSKWLFGSHTSGVMDAYLILNLQIVFKITSSTTLHIEPLQNAILKPDCTIYVNKAAKMQSKSYSGTF